MNDIKISIIIPTLNEAEHIELLVRHLMDNRGGVPMEIMVVDGGSTDATVSLAANSGALVLHSPKRGRAAQMNLGARAAQGEVLYFVHADTLPPPSFAMDILSALHKHKMGCYRYQFAATSWLLRINAWFTRFHFSWCQGGDKTFFISTEDFWQLGGYDEYYTVMEEYDFLRRAKKHFSLHIIPKNAIVSARKYRNNNWLKVQLANYKAFSMFRRGASPDDIKQAYTKWLN
jgi:rSAM/selenodomain-associated transferase 2